MLQNIGDKLKSQRWLATIVLGLLGLIFAVWGAYGVVDISFGNSDYGLKVNGQTISTDTLNTAWQERQAQYEQASGGELPDAQKRRLQDQLVDQYVRQALLRQRVQQDGYRVDDAQVYAAIAAEPAFQIDGKYSAAAAKAALAQAGLSEVAYVADERQSLQVAQLAQAIQLSDFLTPAQLQRIYALENEQRQVRYVLLPPQRYADAVQINDAKVKNWYDAHPKDHLTPESVKLQYALLSLSQVEAALTVTPADLQAYYDKNKSRYSEDEKRHAQHILIQVAAPKDAKADAAALARARDIEQQLKAGADFAKLAKQYSQDPGSAAQGGDLGWGQKSDYVAPFANALFAMQAGQISDPVKTQFGYHIIKLIEVQPAHTRTLAEAHAQIEADYRRDQATEIFGDRQEQLQQKLEGGTVSDLNVLARDFGMKVGELDQFTRSGGAPLGTKADVVRAVFSEDALNGGRLQGPVAVSDDTLAVFKVLEHHVPTAKPLASVRDEVVAAIRKDEGARAAKAAADAALKSVQGGASLDNAARDLKAMATPAAFVGRGDPQLPAQVRDAAFAAPVPAAGKPVYRELSLDDGGAALLALLAVKPGAAGANPKNDEALRAQYAMRDREAQMTAYLLELQRRAKIKRNPDLFQ